MIAPGVSVLIPSIGRPSLARALASVRAQDYRGELQIVVAMDRSPGDVSGELLRQADTVVWTGGDRGGGAARNLAMRSAELPLVAYLDDDDEWMPGKLSTQVAALDAVPTVTVISCRAVQRREGTDWVSAPVPGKTIEYGERIEDYLFRRRSPSITRASVFLPTLLLDRNVGLSVPWDETLRRHQDWDMLLRLQRDAKVRVLQLNEALVMVWLGSLNSISASPDWEATFAWYERWADAWDARTAADFVAGQALRYALHARSAEGVRRCLTELRRLRQVPAAGPMFMGIGGVLSRKTAENFVSR